MTNSKESAMTQLYKKSKSIWKMHVMYEDVRPDIAEYWYQKWLKVQMAINVLRELEPFEYELEEAFRESSTGI